METLLPPPIHFRSRFSLLKGVFSPAQICSLAVAEGAKFLGLTDINNFYGLPQFLRESRSAELLPLAGFAAHCQGKHLFTAYVKTPLGLGRANRIITGLSSSEKRLTKGEGTDFTSPRSGNRGEESPSGGSYNLEEDLLTGGWEGLSLLVFDKDLLIRLAHMRGPENLYLPLVYGLPFRERVQLGRSLGIPLLAVNTAVYSTPKEERLFSLLRSIDRIIPLGLLPKEERATHQERYIEASRVAAYFSALPGAVKNTRVFAEENIFYAASNPGASISGEGGNSPAPFTGRFIFPSFQGLKEEEAYRKLRRLCFAGISRRYGEPKPKILSRLDYELSIIRAKGFSGYFLVVWDLVSRCPRTCGRGSSAASIVSYLLGITHVDPLEHDLFFERFLNHGRKDPPDIDVDFPWDERHKALEYVFETYPGSSAMVADHVTFGPRSCIREPAKAFGMGEREISEYVRKYRNGDQDSIPAHLLRAAEMLRGFPRHLGTHPGGIVITPGSITSYAHVEKSPLGLPVLPWEKDGTEDSGLVKIDLLGNRSLGVLRDALLLVNQRIETESCRWDPRVVDPKAPLDWESFSPLEDRGTRELIERGDTLGVFYVESPATRQLLKKMGCGDFRRLVIASSIIRPAANRSIEEYVRRLHGGQWEPTHPIVEKVLEETLGIMVYQEDVSRIALELCGFSAEEADSLRKLLTRKDRYTRLKVFKERFFNGAEKRGVSKEVLESLWEQVLSFDGYSFCKAHSASYALLSYRLAWIKCYFPLEFFTCVINNGGGFYSRQVYLNALRRLGIPILGPDINRSSWLYAPEEGSLRVGLCQLAEISEPFLKNILDLREREGPFLNLQDFLQRVVPPPAEFRVLVRSGALDSAAFPLTRPQMFWVYSGKGHYPDLFGVPPLPACIGDYLPITKARDEIRTTGLSVSRHPMVYFYDRARITARRLGVSTQASPEIKENLGRNVYVPGMLVTGKEVRTRLKKAMSFLTFEDPYGIFETVVFPEAYAKLYPLLEETLFFIVSGKVTEEQGAVQIVIKDLVPLKGA